jgi:DNA-binding CsgD family transcriptional regulator/PAS domain-containing protein
MKFNTDTDVLGLVGRIYDCVLQPQEWVDVLETIARSVDGINASISIQDPLSKAARFSVDWAVPSEAIRLYNEKYASLNPVLTSGWYCDLDDPISAARYTGEREYFGSRFAKEFLQPLGWGDALGSHLAKMSHRYGILCVFGAWSEGAFDDDALARIRILSPHVRRAVQIAELLEANGQVPTFDADALELLRTGVLLLDAGKRITFCNSAAEQLISRDFGLKRRGDQLYVSDGRAANSLDAAIETALLDSRGEIPDNGIPLAFGRAGSDGLAAWILPLRNRLSAKRPSQISRPKVAIFLQEFGRQAPLAGELFVKQYSISPAECRVLMLLVQGYNVSDTADWLGCSVSTIKTHLSNLFSKTSTNSQTQLVRLGMTALAPARIADEASS